MRIKLSDPVLVAESSFVNETGVDRWGFHQFPVLDRLLDGRIAVTFHINADSARAYGKAAAEPNRAVSPDEGQTWVRGPAHEPVAGLTLPNGEKLLAGRPEVTPRPLEVASYVLPPQRGTTTGSYGQQHHGYYRHDELPPELQGVPVARLGTNGAWQAERARLHDPAMLRGTAEGVFPVTWWGDVHATDSGALLAVVYPGRIEGPDFAHGHVACYRSDDAGHSWQVQGRILYRPESKSDSHAAERDGFTEPASIVLPDGELLAVLRTTDGHGDGPLYLCRSKDEGRTWSSPRVLRANGVLPRLLRLDNGVLVLSTGRPGAELMFSADGRGEAWRETRALVPITSDYNQHDSCGYTSLLAVGRDAFLVAYSWFRKPADRGQTRKAILVRRVQVTL
ncbi:MAG: glycoside hydrolase [Cephaloticoccus sp.]|nr:glycoside hydrolase [Cephaloticoccus sp.]MCF7760434.1 glycoside hydrolase [Cephaloticoccus sp.]